MANTTMTDEKQLLNQIQEGMRVIDRDNADIGLVDRVFLGEVGDKEYERGEGPATAEDPRLAPTNVLPDVRNIFQVDKLPEELCERLLNRGFVRINSSGILHADKYLLPEQIDHVDNKRVYLNVTRKELIKT